MAASEDWEMTLVSRGDKTLLYPQDPESPGRRLRGNIQICWNNPSLSKLYVAEEQFLQLSIHFFYWPCFGSSHALKSRHYVRLQVQTYRDWQIIYQSRMQWFAHTYECANIKPPPFAECLSYQTNTCKVFADGAAEPRSVKTCPLISLHQEQNTFYIPE